jgi:hypothetical protein
MTGVPETPHRDFGPSEVKEEMAASGVSCAVQAHPSAPESRRLIELRESCPFVESVVAAIALTGPALEETVPARSESGSR